MESVTDLLTRAQNLGASFRICAGKVEVLGLQTLPKHVVNDLRASSIEIRDHLVRYGNYFPLDQEISALMLWSATAAELGLETEYKIIFDPPNSDSVSTTRIGLYAAGYLARLARYHMRRRPKSHSPTCEEAKIVGSLAALKAAVDQVTNNPI